MLKNILFRNHKVDEAENWHKYKGHWPLHKFCFYSSRIRTLVAMATYSSHILIMGKAEIDSFVVSLEIFDFFHSYVYE